MTWHTGGRLSFRADNKHRNIFMVVSSQCLEKHDYTSIILRYSLSPSLPPPIPLSLCFLYHFKHWTAKANIKCPRQGLVVFMFQWRLDSSSGPLAYCWEINQYIPPATLGSQPPGSLLVPVALLARRPLASALCPVENHTHVCSLGVFWVLSART